jgi:hypothetical protein
MSQDNLKLPAYPFVDKEEGLFLSGFTKLELASPIQHIMKRTVKR